MRTIDLNKVTEIVKESVIKINYELDNSLVALIQLLQRVPTLHFRQTGFPHNLHK